MKDGLDILYSLLGIVAAIITIIATIFVKNNFPSRKVKQVGSDDAISSNSEGDTSITKGGTVSSGKDTYHIVGNNNTLIAQNTSEQTGQERPKVSGNIKHTCRILFIDDNPLPVLIKTLKKAGWKYIKRIDDIADLDNLEILNADIIFVDIIGVGKKLQFSNGGVGLAAALKERYSEKGIILYSATHEHNIFDPDIKKADDWLNKNAEPIQFSNMIEKYAKPKN